jgi:alkaline ceramidase TOD1/glycosyltransferase MUCI70-like protein
MGDNPFLYTAICGRYEKDRSDIVVFRDKPTDKFVDPVMRAKVYKILPHHFTDAKIRIWMDGNIFPSKPTDALVGELLQDYDIAVFHHPWRKCIYEEYGEARKRLEPKCHPLIDEQVSKYRRDAMPADFGLAECGIILSRSNDATREFFERWWSEISRYSSRDQMSFPYTWWRMKDRIKVRLIGTMRQVTVETRFTPWFRYVQR